MGGGKCNSCRHGKDWRGLYSALVLEEGEWCEECAAAEGYQGDPEESLSAAERNPLLCR